jgi:hypothetical protein
VREGLPFQLISKHVKATKTKSALSPILPDPNNSTYSQTMAQRLDDLRAADEIKELYPLPACRAYLRDRNGI